jgi:hypothetical protein
MAELTQEYFDSVVKNLTTKDDLQKAIAPLATKADVLEGVEELARNIATTVVEPMELHFQQIDRELDMYKEVKRLKADMERIKEALHLSPSGL